MKKKKGDVAATITWFGAFLIIFFIMMLFVSATVLFAGKKYILNNIIPGQEGLNLVPEPTTLTSLIMVNSILDEKVSVSDNSRTIRDMLLQLAKIEGEYEQENFEDRKKELRDNSLIIREEVKKTVGDLLKEYTIENSDKCYVFYVNYNEEWNNPEAKTDATSKEEADYLKENDFLNNEKTITTVNKEEFSKVKVSYTLSQKEPLVFYSGNEYIKIKFYSGSEC